MPLAVAKDTLYGELTIPMARGDQLFICTDGVIDAPGPDDRSLRIKRLEDVL